MNVIRAFLLGVRDGRQGSACGMTYDDDPFSRCSVAYDRGLNVGELVGKVGR